MVATHLNYKEILELYDLALSLGVDSVGVDEVENWYVPGQKEYGESVEFVRKSREKSQEMERLYLELKSKLDKVGIVSGYGSALSRKETCPWPFDYTFVTVDGYVTPCCIRMDKDVFNMGNAFDEGFSNIWNNQKYQDFRGSMIDNTPNNICDDCPGCARKLA